MAKNYEIIGFLDARIKIDAKEMDLTIKQELERLWELEELAKTVFSEYPLQGHNYDGWGSSKNVPLEVKIKKRTEDTQNLLVKLGLRKS